MVAEWLDLDEAIEQFVPDGAHVGIGGLALRRKPIAFCHALVEAGRRGLHASSFLASYDLDILVAGGAATAVDFGYVGYEFIGVSPVLRYDTPHVARRTISEIRYWTGVRAADEGLPFLPCRAGLDPDQAAADDPLPPGPDGLDLVAARHFDVTVLHVQAADARGNLLVTEFDAMEEDDRLLAGAASTVIATVEQRVSDDDARSRKILLHSSEVDVVVLAPEGARPLGMAGHYPPDITFLSEHTAGATRPTGELSETSRHRQL